MGLLKTSDLFCVIYNTVPLVCLKELRKWGEDVLSVIGGLDRTTGLDYWTEPLNIAFPHNKTTMTDCTIIIYENIKHMHTFTL